MQAFFVYLESKNIVSPNLIFFIHNSDSKIIDFTGLSHILVSARSSTHATRNPAFTAARCDARFDILVP